MPQAHAESSEAPCLQIRGVLTPLTTFELYYYDEARFMATVEEKVAKAPKLFENLPIVLSLEKFEGNEPGEDTQPVSNQDSLEALDFELLKKQCAHASLQLVAVRGARGQVAKNAKLSGLAILTSPRSLADPVRHQTENAEQEAEDKRLQPVFQGQPTNESIIAPALNQDGSSEGSDENPADAAAPGSSVTKNKIVTTPVRSGQQIYAEGGDLIVTASVGAGAELLADGNIHVYGALRGRALAGVKGNQSARIFCHSLEAELVSIAGQYRISEDLQKSEWHKACQIFLADGKMAIQALG